MAEVLLDKFNGFPTDFNNVFSPNIISPPLAIAKSEELIDTVLSQINTYKNGAFVALDALSGAYGDTLESLTIPDLNLQPLGAINFGTSVPFSPTVPQFVDSDLTVADIEIPDFNNDIEGIVFDDLNLPNPNSNLPPLLNASAVVPVLSTPVFPTAPDLSTPEAPVLSELTVDTSFTLPVFDSEDFEIDELLEFEVTPFDFTNADYNASYQSDIADAISKQLRDGSAIDFAILAQIADKLTEQTKRESDIARANADIRWSSRGFQAPPGMLNGDHQNLDLQLAIARNNALSEVFSEDYKQRVLNAETAVSNMLAAEQLYANIFDSNKSRELQSAQSKLQSQVSVYQAYTAAYQARLQATRTSIDVFNAQVTAEVQRLNLVISGFAANVDLEEAKVAIYNAQINAVRAQADVFDSQVRAVSSEVEAQGVQIQSYQAEVNAEVSRFNGQVEAYKSSFLSTEISASISETIARNNNSRASVFASQVGAQTDIERLKAEASRLRLDQERVKVDLEIATIGANNDALLAAARVDSAQADALLAQVQRDLAEIDKALRPFESLARSDVAQFEANATIAIEQARFAKDIQESKVANLEATAQVTTSLLATAMSSLNVGAQVGAQNSESLSRNAGSTMSVSTNETYNHTILDTSA
jgi:hypothetical protein